MSEKKKKPTHRQGLPEWLIAKLDIPAELRDGEMRLELWGRGSLLVHGCRRILTYTPQELTLRMKGCVLLIRGEALICRAYRAGIVGVEGRIWGMCFEEESSC